jgi:hypothetical protein
LPYGANIFCDQVEVRASKTLFEGIVEIAEDAIIAVDSSQ